MSYFGRGLQFLGYSYLSRVPLLIWALLIALWAESFPDSTAEPILRGIFDVASPQSSLLSTLTKFASVALAAFLSGTCIGVSARLVVSNAHLRFRAASVDLTPGLELIFRLVPLLSSIAIVATALLRSEAPWAGKLLGIVAGAGFWFVVTVAARRFANSIHWHIVERFKAGGWMPLSQPGYLDFQRGTIQGRHLFATYQFLLALAAYIIYCVAARQFAVPTLSLLLVMITLTCWGLSGIAFFLDHYRAPLLAPMAILAFSGGLFPQSDYFYEGLPRSPKPAVILTAAEVIEAYEKGPDAGTPIVLVATTGGGIQAAAWTARVLTGLNAQITLDGSNTQSSFSRHVRLISSVSGGSVGAMYFAAAYHKGSVDKSAGPNIVASAEQSSLDEVTWGLAYPDLFFGLFPWLKGIGVSSGHLRTSDGGFIFTDRGRTLETSWRERLPAAQSDATLNDWRNDSASGIRPAVIFNATLVETGDRYLLSSTGFIESTESKAKREQYQGRWDFFKLYPDSDLRIRTAARLSSTFPYVTPAARMLRNDSAHSEDGRLYRPEPHAVDGAYYDNYGMASLLDWLDNGLQAIPTRPKIMIIEIRASPIGEQGRPRASSYGAFFQLTNPLQTMANVRGTGQLSHNALDENLMNRIYSPKICEATFEFDNTDARGCPRTEPLNWHLTPNDRRALQDAWNNSDAIKQNIARVQTFLAGGACPP